MKKIVTARLVITEIKPGDVEDIHRMNSFPSVAQFNTIGIPSNITQTEQLLKPIIEDKLKEERTQFMWAIRKKETQEFVGQIGMHLSAKRYRRGEIYYSLHPDHWGNGYATEAVQSIISYGFNQLQLHRIEAGVSTENVRSIQLLERLGMSREGLRRKILPIGGEWKDNYEYGILEEDPRDY